jgi:hypothetical protein
MSAKVESLPRQARPNIAEVLELFLKDQRKRLKPRTLSNYEGVVQLLQDYLNGYAHQSLSTAEARLFDQHFNAEGDEHREFTQLFGPEKILEHVEGFLGTFMIRKVMASEDFKRSAGTVTKKLSKWLAANGYISAEAAEDGARRSTEAGNELVVAERAARLLQDASEQLGIDTLALADEDYEEFDHFTIARIEPGRLWLEVWDEGEPHARGPIRVPKGATELLQKGWDVSCSLARVRGRWHLVEVANVYPL